MKGLFRKRGGGKTTALVYTSAITGYPIVVPTTISKRYVKDVARRVGVSIPEPIVMSEDARGRRIGGVLIDNAEEIIRAYAAQYDLFLTGGSDFHGKFEGVLVDIGDYLAEPSGVRAVVEGVRR